MTGLEGGDWIRGITIRQPWATCILAGKTTDPLALARLGPHPRREGEAGPRPAVRPAGGLHDPRLRTPPGRGHRRRPLTDCHLDQGPERCTSPWAQREAHHLVLTDVHELPLPVPATGALPAWKPTQALVDHVLQQLPDLWP